MDVLRDAFRTITSKPVQRAVVNTVLLASGIATLLGLAAVASALFFQAYVPDQVLKSPVYLQYGSSTNPYGVAPLATPKLKTLQEYDISVTFSIPRSPANLERGNFMVSLYLVDSRGKDALDSKALAFAREHVDFGNSRVLFTSRRPALVPYVDPVVSLTSRVLFMAYHLFSSKSQRHQMTINLAEHVAFPKESVLPASAYIEVEAGQDIQIYSTELVMTAQLRGLRYLMVHYRLVTYIVFTMMFWFCEVLFMSAAWTVWSSATTAGDDQGRLAIKGRRTDRLKGDTEGDDDDHDSDDNDDEDDEDEDGGDHASTKRLTSGASRQTKAEPGIKDEDHDERLLADIPTAGAEADDELEYGDEDEDVKGHRGTSGVATSYSKEGRESMRWRAPRSP